MLYVDTPTAQDITALNTLRADACVSIYVPTTPLTQEIGAAIIAFRNHTRDACGQLEAAGVDKRRIDALREGLEALADDGEFWRVQAHSLAVFATPERVLPFRLANQLTGMVAVSDRFHIKPLLRAVAFPHEALVLAVSEQSVRLVQVFSDLPPQEVKVPGMPKDAPSFFGKASINDRSADGRLQGAEGQRVRHLHYLRAIDSAIRPVLAGRTTPLILAAVDPLGHLFAGVCTSGTLLPGVIRDNVDQLSDGELAQRSRAILDEAYAGQVAALTERFHTLAGAGRAITDLSDAARLATWGAIDTLLVDMDDQIHGTIDDQGVITRSEGPGAASFDIVDEIAGRVLAAGGRVLAVRRAEIPGGGTLAGMLRYTP
jgi:hypothetical protein